MRRFGRATGLGWGITILLIMPQVNLGQDSSEYPCGPDCQEQKVLLREAAQALEKQEQYEAAAAKYQELIAQEPMALSSLEADLQAAQCYRMLNQTEQALASYLRAIEVVDQRLQNPRDSAVAYMLAHYKQHACMRMAQLLEEGNREEEAVQSYILAVNTGLLKGLASTRREMAGFSQQAAARAAHRLKKLGRLPEALAFLDLVTEIGKSKGFDESSPVADQILHRMKEALATKAKLCADADRREEALAAIEAFRDYFVASSDLSDLEEIEAHLLGEGTVEADARHDQEKEAAKLLETATRDDVLNADPSAALTALDAILTNYPGTGAALRTRDAKGHILFGQERYEEAARVYKELVEILSQRAPLSCICRDARVSLKRSLLEGIIQKRLLKEAVPDEQRQLLWKVCQDIRQYDPRVTEQVQTMCSQAEAFYWLEDPENALKTVDELLWGFLKDRPREKFTSQVAWAHHYAGMSLQKLHRWEEAIEHFRWITQMAESHPEQLAGKKELMPHVYYRLWRCLRNAKAEAGELDAVVAKLNEQYPESDYLRYMKADGNTESAN